MARASTSEKVGRGPCPHCSETITYRKSKGGLLTWKCEECDHSGYATPGGASYAKLIASLIPKTDQAPAPADPVAVIPETVAPAPAPAPKPAKKAVNSVFSLGQL